MQTVMIALVLAMLLSVMLYCILAASRKAQPQPPAAVDSYRVELPRSTRSVKP